MSAAAALLSGLRRSGDEAQLTRAIAAVCEADAHFASQFLSLVLERTPRPPRERPEANVTVAVEEVIPNGRVDLRFRGRQWDVIIELKIHAGYGPGQLERYLGALTDAPHAYLAAITRDVPTYGEREAEGDVRWRGSVRWKSLRPSLRDLSPADADLASQWRLFLDVLETEGTMGFIRPDPELFAAYGEARRAILHIEELLRSIQTPLLQALRDARGGDEGAASFYWKSGRRLGRTRLARISVPFRVPADGPWRVRAGFISWNPPASFFVQAGPDQRWDRRRFSPEARRAVDAAVARGFDPTWMAAYRPLDEAFLAEDRLEERLVAWAHERFVDLVETGLVELPLSELGDAAPPADDTDEP